MEAARESQLTAAASGIRPAGCPARRPGAALSLAAALAAGLALRLWMLKDLFQVNGDSLIYGGSGKEPAPARPLWLDAGRQGASVPTLIRLPGYPLFLALCFRLFGMENYFSAALLQIVLELARLPAAGRLRPPHRAAAASRRGARHATLWLAALCPFTASYAVVPLAETPTLFALALALWAAARFHDRPGWGSALWFTFAVTFAALLRPDGALVAVALAPALVIGLVRSAQRSSAQSRSKNSLRMALVCVLLALAPFAVWTARNWQTFHVFQPLAPRQATDPGRRLASRLGALDQNLVPRLRLHLRHLLERARRPARRGPAAQPRLRLARAVRRNRRAGRRLQHQRLRPHSRYRRPLCTRWPQERIAAHPLRYYLWLPLGRLADMWLRPRVENLNIDLDWWVYAHHHAETRFSWAYAALNALYLLLAAVGLWLRPRFWKAMLAYMLLRSALLLTVEAPETRYTLECFPMLFALGGCLSAYKLDGAISG